MGGNLDQLKGFIKVGVWAVALMAAGALASCAMMPSSELPVQTSNPSVSYNFQNDQELLTAHQNATTYCMRYQGAPRIAVISDNPNGGKIVQFDCIPTSFPLPPPASPTLSYHYRTEQELVQASQTAGAYCQRYGSQPMTSSITTNEYGVKTVTFQCGLR